MKDKDPWKKSGEALRGAGDALAVPSVFLGGPLAGAGLGYLVSLFVGHRETCMLVGVLVGFAAAIWEIVRFIRSQSDGPGK